MASWDDFTISMDFPGWTKYRELVHICQYISNNDVHDILCAGTFGGRVAATICQTFPHIHVTAIDTFSYIETYKVLRERTDMTCGDRFLNEQQSLDHYKSMHNYQNITARQIDFFNYNTKHQMIINEMFPHPYGPTWENVFDHCLLLSDHVIGAKSQISEAHGEWGTDVLQKLYNYEIVNEPDGYHDVYRILSKKS